MPATLTPPSWPGDRSGGQATPGSVLLLPPAPTAVFVRGLGGTGPLGHNWNGRASCATTRRAVALTALVLYQ